jgi:uncharacterized protein (TIGR00266 family)
MLRYTIEGENLPVVICYPEANQTVLSETGAMSWMSPNIRMDTNSGGGIKKALGRMFAGESLFMNEFTAQGGMGTVAFASSFPGSIIPYEVPPGNSIIVQKHSFLAMEKGLDLSIYFQKKLGKGLFGGEGFVMNKISGSGLVFIEIDGYCKEYTLEANESIIVDTGYLAAMSESCTMDIEAIEGAKNIFLGGMGLFHTKVTGPGKVYLQTMPIIKTAKAIEPYITFPTNTDGGNGINIRLGE